jgi:hypothetical protein
MRPQPAACSDARVKNVLDRGRHRGKYSLQLSAQQVGKCQRLPTIWNVDNIDACHGLEQLEKHVRRTADAARTNAQLARILFRL